MRSLYLRGYVNGKPLTKMFVDGGAAVNVMPYTTFRKLGMGPGDMMSHPILQGKPNASHVCARINLHTHDRQNECNTIAVIKRRRLKLIQ
jgi:predicted aspartyl protease